MSRIVRKTKKRKRCSTSLIGDNSCSGDNTEIIEGKQTKKVPKMDFDEDLSGEGDENNDEPQQGNNGNLFNSTMSSYIVKMMSLEVDSGRAKGGIWNKTTWPRIHKKFNRYFQVDYTGKQVKAKWDRIKRDYQTFQYLLNHTGFGWNENRKIPTAPEETWEKEIMLRNNAKQFKTKTLAHYDILHKIFGGSSATDKFSCTSAQFPLSDDMEAERFDGHPQDSNTSPFIVTGNEDDMSTSTRVTSSRKGQAQITAPTPKKKGRNDVYNSAMQVISDSTIWKGEKVKSMSKVFDSVVQFNTPAPPPSDPKSIMEMMLKLKGRGGIDAETFAKACGNLESVYNRRMFAAMDDESQIAWMKYSSPRTRNPPIHPC